jgi:hypothetical protein
MPVRVIIPPDPIVAPEDISGVQAGDTAVEAMIAAVTEVIDGPQGWLGRSLGPQTLEMSGWFECGRLRLPYGPVIKIETVSSEDCDGNAEDVDPATWRQDGDEIVIANGARWATRYWHRITYKAGYNGTSGAAAGELQTGAVPERARQAIVLSVRHMRTMSKDDLFLKVDEVEGIGRREYTVSDQAGRIIETTCDRLLQGLRLFA